MKNLDYSNLDKLFQATSIFALRFLGYEYIDTKTKIMMTLKIINCC